MLPSFYTELFKQDFESPSYHLPDSQFPIIKMGLKPNSFQGRGARRIHAEVLNAQKLHCWGSEKDVIVAPAIPTLLLWRSYPSLSTRTFRIQSDPSAAMFSALRNQPLDSTMTELHWSLSPSFRDRSWFPSFTFGWASALSCFSHAESWRAGM